MPCGPLRPLVQVTSGFPGVAPVAASQGNTLRKQYDFSAGKRVAVIASPGKTRITIMLDDDILEHFRAKAAAEGIGCQTAINAALRGGLSKKRGKAEDDRPLTVAVLRKVLREELNET